MAAGPIFAAEPLDGLFDELSRPDNPEWQRVESDILREWSKSGSPTMDLLLKRGEDAMAAGDTAAAVEHFTALTDHAPDFAEGWSGLAAAYFAAGEEGPALEALRRTLILEPRHFGALAGLAGIAEARGDLKRAQAIYRQLQAIHPHFEGLDAALTRISVALEGKAA